MERSFSLSNLSLLFWKTEISAKKEKKKERMKDTSGLVVAQQTTKGCDTIFCQPIESTGKQTLECHH